MTPAGKRKLLQILPFPLFGLIFGLVYAVIEFSLLGKTDHYPKTGNSYHYISTSVSTILQSLLMGTLLGVAEVFWMNRFLANRSFVVRFFLKSVFYFVIIAICLASFSAISSSITTHEGLFDQAIRESVTRYFTDASFWSIMLLIGIVFSLSIMVTEMSLHLGHGVFLNFILGKYQVPREEERIFMFIDLKGSTTLAEKMGHIPYYKFLNQYYVDISKAIVDTGGEIYQYVGDEVVITWELQNKLTYDKCITCFFMIKSIIKSKADWYQKTYGTVPEFKAGLHCGKVTTGRIGILKKEIVFTGDVLNTTFRIQSNCNQHQVDNLMSEALVRHLQKNSAYRFRAIGDIPLRGKAEPLKLYTV